MQRLFSLVMLGVLGGIGWLVLKGGGLDQLSIAPRNDSPAKSPATAPFSSYQTPGPWAGPTTNPAGSTSNSQAISNGQATAGPSSGPALRIAAFNIQDFGNKKAGAAAMLSRAMGGLVEQTVVLTMPGSTAAVRLAMEKIILPELSHLVSLAKS